MSDDQRSDSEGGRRPENDETGVWVLLLLCIAVAAAIYYYFAQYGSARMGGGIEGRPLRVRGRQTHASLHDGDDWTLGEQPAATGLDVPTREALAALWWHDAQHEHASVPAFARIAWLLAAAGAPADLLIWANRAAIEEVGHARACFALAAGYARRSRTVDPMPQLMLEGFSEKDDPVVILARESLADGCQIEGFNADVAAARAAVCVEPVTRLTLERIAREERSHAEFSWAVLDWLLARHRDAVLPVLEDGLSRLDQLPRPVAVSFENRRLVAAANAGDLRAHGRIADAEWARIWASRLADTRDQISARLNTPAPGKTYQLEVAIQSAELPMPAGIQRNRSSLSQSRDPESAYETVQL